MGNYHLDPMGAVEESPATIPLVALTSITVVSGLEKDRSNRASSSRCEVKGLEFGFQGFSVVS